MSLKPEPPPQVRFRRASGIALSVFAWSATSIASATAATNTFERLEARLSGALAAYDRATLDTLWDDRLVFVFPDGTLSHKADRLKAQVPPPDAHSPKLVATNDAVSVEFADDHVAVVIVRSSWRFGDQPPRPFLATHIWIKRRTGWRLLSAQVAQVTPPKASTARSAQP